MKKTPFLSLGLALALCACHCKSDPLIGSWTVDKVNVQFDERHDTPELVKQVGEMERHNRLTISADSLLTLTTLDGVTQGRLSLTDDGVIRCDGEVFGRWEDGQIVTTTPSPIGDILIRYRKERAEAVPY